MRTIDVLIENKLPHKEERQYLRTLFENSKVNRLFMYGVQIDNNPKDFKDTFKMSKCIHMGDLFKIQKVFG